MVYLPLGTPSCFSRSSCRTCAAQQSRTISQPTRRQTKPWYEGPAGAQISPHATSTPPTYICIRKVDLGRQDAHIIGLGVRPPGRRIHRHATRHAGRVRPFGLDNHARHLPCRLRYPCRNHGDVRCGTLDSQTTALVTTLVALVLIPLGFSEHELTHPGNGIRSPSHSARCGASGRDGILGRPWIAR